ncbi:Aste57867_7745 [Aphanomyces stellatus]|uniref:Aste57867_7745 protein n=1 Tax=Aphanomyces stellatus TaxID=120398 RepID=A0A485KIS9_9STRA|nr:hypothetical protein As57867_007716 [Aphanomyces stellatus]VFT84645.1 Aste57867_7745 [Aphanomyces stellatus]
MRAVSALLLSLPIAWAQRCPYTDLAKGWLHSAFNIAVADKRWCPPAASDGRCVVNQTCGVVQSNQYDFVGSFVDVNASLTELVLDPSTTYANVLNLTMASFPDTISSLVFAGDYNLQLPSPFTWPSQLVKIAYVASNAGPSSVVVPPAVDTVMLKASAITQPRTLAPSVQHLYVVNDEFISPGDFNNSTHRTLVGNAIGPMDGRNIATLTLGGSPRIVNIQLSNKTLVSLTILQSTTISSWTMDVDTFHALNQLKPRGNYTLSAPPDDTHGHKDGFYYTAELGTSPLVINTSGPDCAADKGTLKELWPFRQPVLDVQTGYTETKSQFLVCVTEFSGSTSSTNNSSLTGVSLSTGAIVGLVAGVVAAVVVVAVLYCMRRRQRRRRAPADPTYHSTLPLTLTPTRDNDDDALRMHDLDLVRLDARALTLSHVLGTGAFADVLYGVYLDQPVAVKMLHARRVSTTQVQALVHEILLLSTFDSPYIVKLVGAVWSRPSDLACVLELMDGGDLRDHLTRFSPAVFAWQDKYMHIHSVVQGLVYLRSLNVIHRDVKSRNILLDSIKGTKLTDFGISKEDIQATMTVGVGTFRWMAPEVILDHQYTVAADIYSFGCVLSEFSTHQVPYEDVRNPANGEPLADTSIMVKVVAGTLQPSFEVHTCPAWIHELALHCLAMQPRDRPTAYEVAHVVRTKLKDLAADLYNL